MFTLVLQSTSRKSGQNSTASQGVQTQRTASVPTTTKRPKPAVYSIPWHSSKETSKMTSVMSTELL
ncbi:hypothetical protein DPMN_098158 [Dreissena polymorpha]|uniref:Uncharacterized protein n=1 Tax=Dreissena polymorpha TaxID=45954 RepID=A0A9D4LD26_DREPO|nr:hypothetical protein DPMN_098158 [Dreissena polymorpha]